MADYNDLEDWELLQSPDVIPSVASVASAVDHGFFVPNHDKKSSASVDQEVSSKLAVDRGEIGDLNFRGVVEGNLLDLGRKEGDGVRGEVAAKKENGSGIDAIIEDVGIKTESGVSPGLSSSDLDDTVENSSDLSRNNCGGVMEVIEEGEGSRVAGVTEDIKAKDGEEPSSGKEVSGERSIARSASGNLSVENGRRSDIVVWWKLPLNLVKYCVFKVTPVWSLSMAVAILGFAVLGRKLYKMKRRGPTVPVRVGVDAKKVSKSVAQPAFLKEAVLAMRRVHFIKASLPTSGATPWPALALR